jgi:hypothetical protein
MAAISPLEDTAWALELPVLNRRMPVLYEGELVRRRHHHHHPMAVPAVFPDPWDHHLQAYHPRASMVLGNYLLTANIKAKPSEVAPHGCRQLSILHG